VSPTGRIFHIASANHAHNIFLQLMVCNGVLGLGAFLWTFIKTTLIAWRLGAGRQGGLLCWSFILVTIGLAGWNIYDPFYATLVFFFMAMIGVSTGDGYGVETP
jgi:O-antigen ligase